VQSLRPLLLPAAAMANLGNAYEQERELRILKNKEELRRLTQGCQLVTSVRRRTGPAVHSG